MNIAIKSNSVFDVIMGKSHLKLGIYFALGCMYRFFKSCLDRFLLSQIVMLMSFLVVFLCFVYDYNFSYIRPIITIVLLINIAGILADEFNCNHLENVGKGTLGIYIFHFFFTFKLYVIGHFLSEISVVGLSTSIIIQSILVVPISYIIIRCCMFFVEFIKTKSLLSLGCLGKF